MPEELALLAYELSQRMLTQQEMRLDELRARTGTLLAASSVATSFLGPRAIDRNGVDTLALLALTAFAVSVIGSVSIPILNPRLVFGVRRTRLFEEEPAREESIADVHRRLGYWLELFFDQNQATVDRLFLVYQLAAVAVLAEVILWTIKIAI
ncbi:MAG: hypothetical protein ACXW0R_10220 [Gaiellaceae bacterium]